MHLNISLSVSCFFDTACLVVTSVAGQNLEYQNVCDPSLLAFFLAPVSPHGVLPRWELLLQGLCRFQQVLRLFQTIMNTI